MVAESPAATEEILVVLGTGDEVSGAGTGVFAAVATSDKAAVRDSGVGDLSEMSGTEVDKGVAVEDGSTGAAELPQPTLADTSNAINHVRAIYFIWISFVVSLCT